MDTDRPTVTGYFSTRQVADILNISQQEVRQLIKSGEIVAEKQGRNYRIPAPEFRAYIKRRMAGEAG